MARTLNIGCGFDKISGAINLDIDPRCNPDCLCDVTKGIPFDDGSFNEVVANNVLEHIFDYESVMIEIHRVLKLGGKLIAQVPLWPSRVSIAGDGHVRQFVIESFILYTNPAYFQPKKHPSNIAGLFELVHLHEEKAITQTGKDGEWITNLNIQMKKVDKQHWKNLGVHLNIQVDVHGCFWCQHELEVWRNLPDKTIKRCPNCLEQFEILKRGQNVVHNLQARNEALGERFVPM
jgi:SAM-dependent methyltransferase